MIYLLSFRLQDHVMLIKKNEIDPDLVLLLGADIMEELKITMHGCFDIHGDKLLQEMERSLKNITKVS